MTVPSQQPLFSNAQDTQAPYPRDRCVHHLVEDQVDRSPNAVAAVYAGQTLTYADLDRRANRLARRLLALGVVPDSIVGLHLDRSLEMLVALLGVLKAGAAYLPLDPALPAARLTLMVEDARAQVVLTEERLKGSLGPIGTPVHCLDAASLTNESSDRPSTQVSATNLAYVLYTSGSTGRPKGVQIEHRSFVNFLGSMLREPGLGSDDVMLALTTLSFDIAGLEIFLPLIVGATIVLVSRADARDGAHIASALANSGATFMQATPATWRLLLEAGWQGTSGLTMVCGGEALDSGLAHQLLRRGAVLWNGYGPTETTVYSTLYRVHGGTGMIPIGQPIANTYIALLDEECRSVAAGGAGELYIGGDGLARGYLNRPDLTAERFVADPNSEGGRLYRTGDLARIRPDGNIEYLGRLDQQVKIRGCRIELGEIEAVLCEHLDVHAAAVTVREDSPGEKRLIAYFVARAGQRHNVDSLRSHLRDRLPDYMLPACFIAMERFPLTTSGKVDRAALPAPGTTDGPHEVGIGPRDELETRLITSWQRLLGTRSVSIDDNFFDLGGHSLLAARLMADIEKTFGRRLPLALLFEAPTVRQIAEHLRQDQPTSWSCLVPIQPRGTRPPLFCVHPVGGNILGFEALVKHLDADQPVYGIQAHGLDGQQKPMTRVEEMAAHYLRLIREVQPEGPYRLAGLSFGGVVAFEMAQQLRKAGQRVVLLATLDTQAHRAPISLGRELIDRARVVSRLDWRARWRYLSERLRGIRIRIGTVLRAGACVVGNTPGSSLDETLRQVEGANQRATRDYVPGPYEGRLVIFRAHDQFVGEEKDPLRWADLAEGGADVHDIPGDHETCVRDPNVQIVARKLTGYLERVRDEK